MQIKKPETFEELLNLQKILDETVGKPRENKFIPGKRTYIKICKSMIAEIIEFNEETLETHKTWKQKEFRREKMVEEAIDIMFFYAQLVNNCLDSKVINVLKNAWIEVCSYDDYDFDDDIELALINLISKTSFGTILGSLLDVMALIVALYNKNNITKEDVFNVYWEKWQKNMERVNKDWTLKK